MADNSNLPKKRLHTAERAFFVQRESQNWFLMYMLLRLTLITHCPSQRGGQRSSAVSELHKIWGNGLLVFLWSTCKMQVVTSKFQRFHWVNGKASLPVCVFILCNRCQRMLLKEISYKSTSQRFNWVNGKASLPACLYLAWIRLQGGFSTPQSCQRCQRKFEKCQKTSQHRNNSITLSSKWAR